MTPVLLAMVSDLDPIASAARGAPRIAATAGVEGKTATWRLSLPGPGGLASHVQLVSFDATAFAPAAFARHAIACPDAVTDSVATRQAEFFFGRLAARAALRELAASGVAIDVDAVIGIGPAREPLWPPGVVGSISHCDGLAAAIALPADGRRGIGIDVERVVTDDLRPALFDGALDAGERRLLDAVAGAGASNALLTIAFSAKESLFKGAYARVGRYFGFAAARVCELDLARGCLHVEIREDLGPTLPRGTRCRCDFLFVDDATVLTVVLL